MHTALSSFIYLPECKMRVVSGSSYKKCGYCIVVHKIKLMLVKGVILCAESFDTQARVTAVCKGCFSLTSLKDTLPLMP
jgi:hypothetical protein